MAPTGASAGSLQVMTVSPLRAAGFLLIMTVALPFWTVPRFAGGVWKAVPGGVGRCGGTLSAVLPTVAAGFPMMLTVALRPPFSMPENPCGSGVGTCPDGDGTITTWVSTA